MEGTCNQIRSSASIQASQHLSEKERKQVAKTMCHDPTTADRFYVALPDKDRNLRLKVLKSALDRDEDEDKEEEKGSTSSSAEEPPYDDHTESDSSPFEKEMTKLRQRHRLTPKSSKRKLFIGDPRSGSKTPKKCKILVQKLGTPIAKYGLVGRVVSVKTLLVWFTLFTFFLHWNFLC
ncbi:hypothetical protein PFLUV_G00127750 [Perca fluviatilis]|uniref:Uncharacterized protein n=1 Tax=Perca fluviatilis TaxID=8168 RepID=A0A6A5ESS9_PERFL|nr:hypothetical protein PFLUV_G00127750 [Perca fluviatilis]